MLCPNCGTENPENSVFCESCGQVLAASIEEAPLDMPPMEGQDHFDSTAVETYEEPIDPREPMKEKSGLNLAVFKANVAFLLYRINKPLLKNKLIFSYATAAAILLVTIGVILGINRTCSDFITAEATYFSEVVDDKVVIIRGDDVIRTDVRVGYRISSSASSLDGSTHVLLTLNRQLCSVSGKRVKVLARDVVGFALSANGKGIVYKNDEGELYLCNSKTGKKTLVDADFQGTTYCISPDGKSVLYNDITADGYMLQYFSGKHTVSLTTEEVIPVGLSDDGKYIYALEINALYGNKLYCYNKNGEREVLGDLPHVSIYYYFNSDHTQILFYDDEGNSYISSGGEAGQRISANSIQLLYADNATYQGSTYPVKDLYGHVYVGYDGNYKSSAWFIHKNPDKSCKLISDIYYPTLDSSGKFMYYRQDGDLYYLKISHKNDAGIKAKRIAFDVDSWVITSDRSKVYYVSDGTLYSANGKTGTGRKTVAAEHVEAKLVISAHDVVFYIQNDCVYACSNGRTGKYLLADADTLRQTPDGLVYVYDDNESVYVSGSGKRLKKLIDFS